MMDDRRRRLGRFGVGRRVASLAAIAILAASPAIASLADAHLDGVVLAIAEVVFAEPVSAQECTDSNGDPRVCTATEDAVRCMNAAADSAQQCLDGAAWWEAAFCYATLAVDSAACVIDYAGDVALPFG